MAESDAARLRRLLAERRSEVLAIARRHGASDVRVFGSVARGDAGPASDIDLLVRFAPGRSLFDHVALKQDLEDLLGVRVDVINQPALYPPIRDAILSEAVPV